MIRGIRRHINSVVLLGSLGLAATTASLPAHAGQGTTQPVSALRLTVDKPIIHLGENVRIAGQHFTPGARVAISLHGPMSATGLGCVNARVQVAGDGDFSVRLSIVHYPDEAAHQLHTVVVAAISPVMADGVQEGAAVAVRVDPMPGIDIVTRARLVRTSLTIDGTAVPALVTARGGHHYRISYAGHLRAGSHTAYLKWLDATGGWGARSWSFHTGSPYAVTAAPSLSLSPYRIRLGDDLGVAGNGFTPGAVVTIRLGGPNEPPDAPVATAPVDATGAFRWVIHVIHYPSAQARASHSLYVDATASGATVGDLPEGAAAVVRVVG